MQATDDISRFRAGELGYLGLNMFNGVSTDELKKELNFPYSLKTYKQMQYHDAINSALSSYENLISKATWEYLPPSNPTEQEKKQAEIINQMMKDMEHTWDDFIQSILSMNTFGFCINEKVYRKRYKSNGSKFDDGLIGWKKLPIRSQESIQRFIFSDDGNDFLGVEQNLAGISDPYGRYTDRSNRVILPISKVMLFRQGNHRGDPFGKSPLRGAYLAWRFLTVLEELEAIGVNKDLSGVPLLRLPAQYLSADASPEQKAIKSYYEAAIRNLQAGSQAGVILPQAFDPDSKQPLFNLELLSTDGKRGFDIDKIKTYYKNAIYTSLGADGLILGQSNSGSFALATFKSSSMFTNARKMITIIKNELEQSLIKQTYELNGWDVSRMGSLDVDGLVEADLETMSKYLQRTAAVGLVPKNLDVINHILQTAGIDTLPEDTSEDDLVNLLTPTTSRSGDGMQQGMPSGTGSANGSSGDSSSINADNNA